MSAVNMITLKNKVEPKADKNYVDFEITKQNGNFLKKTTPFAVHYEKIRIHLCEMTTNSVKIHSLAPKNEHLRVTQIQ